MTRLVLKFGGTSLSTAQTFENIFKILLPKRESIIDKDYFKRYYHTSHLSDRLVCDICGRSASVQKMF